MTNLARKLTTKVYIPHTSGKSLNELGLTIVHPFYNEKKRFKIQLRNWRDYENETKDCINIILSDDHSSVPLHTYLEKRKIDFNLEVHRVKDNLKWSTPGALNLGIKNAKTDWIMIMDSDCLLTPDQIKHLLKLRPDNGFTYRFNRNRISNIPIAKDHKKFLPCTILFTREAYDAVGGFDEDFTGSHSGGYGYFDNDFSLRLLEAGYWQGIMQDVVVTEYLEDIVGPNIQQKTGVKRDEHHGTNKRLWYAKMNGEIPRNRDHLNFKWEKTFEYNR